LLNIDPGFVVHGFFYLAGFSKKFYPFLVTGSESTFMESCNTIRIRETAGDLGRLDLFVSLLMPKTRRENWSRFKHSGGAY